MNTKQPAALVVLSGGQDSTVCLYYAKDIAQQVHAITFYYGQRHAVELEAARHVAVMAGVVTHKIVTLPAGVLESTSPLVQLNTEVEQYPNADALPGGIEKTFVPMRNQLFLTLAVNRAVCVGATVIFTGLSQEDYGGYPDCREDFVRAFNVVTQKALGESVARVPHVYAPLMYRDKAETVRLSERLPGCREALAYSHTCYNGAVPPCGHCHACLLRARGYADAHFSDPLLMRLSREGC